MIEEDFDKIVERALQKETLSKQEISHWCIHPGGKRILEAIYKSLALSNGQLSTSYKVLNELGNLSSASVVFVLKEMLKERKQIKKLFGAAFGPGLTVETFTAH